ncbi:MAG: hypothetical protein IKO39_06735 [Treponema sp.]|nr:hypothetical protein [Treponema sp.]
MKTKTIIFILLISFLLFGCASSKFAINECASVAVIGVTGNKNLSEQVDTLLVRSDEEDIDDTSLLSTLVDKFLHGENPELLTGQDRVDYTEECLRHSMEEIAGLKVATKEDVLSANEYKNSIKSPLGFMDTWATATGFDKNLYSIGAKKARILMNELGVDSLVAAEFRFNKVFDDESKVKTKVHAQVLMDVIFYDKTGKKKIIDTFKADASEKLPVRKFKYDTEALIAQYPSVIESVINKFIVTYIY